MSQCRLFDADAFGHRPTIHAPDTRANAVVQPLLHVGMAN